MWPLSLAEKQQVLSWCSYIPHTLSDSRLELFTGSKQGSPASYIIWGPEQNRIRSQWWINTVQELHSPVPGVISYSGWAVWRMDYIYSLAADNIQRHANWRGIPGNISHSSRSRIWSEEPADVAVTLQLHLMNQYGPGVHVRDSCCWQKKRKRKSVFSKKLFWDNCFQQ